MCCGSNRAAARAAAMANGAVPGVRSAPSARADAAPGLSVIMFEYVGAGSAAVRGPVSRRLYRFDRPGDRLQVDARDRLGLAAMASLRWVR